jgi:Bacterial PH domain
MERYMVFHAPWSKKLSYTTLLSVILLFGFTILGRIIVHGAGRFSAFMVTGFPLLLAGGSSFFIIKGYIVSGDTIFVQRLFWNSRIDLDGLVSCEVDPKAMAGSIRTFANGGLFCIAGYFRNDKLGKYRAFVTHPSLSVVLYFKDHTIVVTPDNPEQFVAALRARRTQPNS